MYGLILLLITEEVIHPKMIIIFPESDETTRTGQLQDS